MRRNRVLWPQHSVKVWWLDVGRCWPLKPAIGFDFWGRPGFFSFPKYIFPPSRWVHFLSTFWALMAKSACFWTACPAFSVTCFTGPQGTPPPSFLASKTVASVSSPLFVFMGFYFPSLFCHCSLASGGIGGKWICSTAMVIQKFSNLGFLLLAANDILMLSVFSHRNILWHDIEYSLLWCIINHAWICECFQFPEY